MVTRINESGNSSLKLKRRWLIGPRGLCLKTNSGVHWWPEVRVEWKPCPAIPEDGLYFVRSVATPLKASEYGVVAFWKGEYSWIHGDSELLGEFMFFYSQSMTEGFELSWIDKIA